MSSPPSDPLASHSGAVAGSPPVAVSGADGPPGEREPPISTGIPPGPRPLPQAGAVHDKFGGRGSAGPPRGVRARLREIGFFLPYIRRCSGVVALMIGLSMAAELLSLPLTFVPEKLTLHFDDKPWLWWYLAAATVATILGGLCSLLEGYYGNVLGERMVSAIRQDVFSRMERLSMQAVTSHGPGPLVQRLLGDVAQIRGLFAGTLAGMVTQVLQGLILTAVMLWQEPVLTVVLLGVFMLVAPFVRWMNRTVEFLARRIQLLSEDIVDQMVEAVGGFRDIQASGRFDRFRDRFNHVVGESEQAGIRAGLWAHLAGSLPTFAGAVLIVVPYFLAVGRLDSVQDVGRMITYAMLLGQVMPTMSSVVRSTSIVARAGPALREVRAALSDPPSAEPARPTPVVATAPLPDLEAGNLSVQIDHVGIELGGRTIIEDLTFEIPGGKFTAVVGQSGSGKTTLFHMLLRLLEPGTGTIRINGRALSEIPLPQLRRLVGFIPQNPFIFNLSLRDNLLIAAPDQPSPDAVSNAVDRAQLEELIRGREQQGGLEALAGHMGARLSGGERQRVALARLFLQDPQIVICDEYTANIDVKTAALIQQSIDTYFRDRTRIVITHQLYSVRNADRIVVLDAGRVVQVGTHGELVSVPGLYRELCEVQALI